MMPRYIDADKIDYRVIMVGQDENAGYRAVAYESDIDEMPTADVIDRKTHEAVCKQIMWERDIAIGQLKEIGKSFGEKMDDVAPVVHGRWEPQYHTYYNRDGACQIADEFRCSECGRTERDEELYCHCGAKMDLKEGDNGG